ncbi:MAG: hypothetical protein WKF71_18615 [Pyrinomonadaceae bacterium]|jgi:hypothetical protein
MTTKATVKVIKKKELKSLTEPELIEVSTKQAAREMVSTVTGWVNDFHHRRREETKKAFEILFSSQPKTSEM